MFARHAAGTAEVERALHESLLTELGIQDIDAMPVAPTTLAYTSYLLATAYRGTFADGSLRCCRVTGFMQRWAPNR